MIRKAAITDIPALVDLSIEALNVESYPQLVIDREKVYACVKDCVHSAMNFAWVSEIDGVIQGGLGAQVVPLPVYERSQANVFMWYCRQPGDGWKLMQQFMHWMKPRMMIKQCVYTGNKVDPRIEKLFQIGWSKLGSIETLPTYVLTR